MQWGRWGCGRGYKQTYESVWGSKRKQTHRGDLKHLKCLAGALSDIWWLNCHRPVLSTNASLVIPFGTCFDLFIKIQKMNEKG